MNFSLKLFWKVGAVSFFIIGVMGVISLIYYWNVSMWFQKVSGIADVIFRFTLAYLFFWFLTTNKIPENEEIGSNEEMLEVLEN